MDLREMAKKTLLECATLKKSDLIIGSLGTLAFGSSYFFDSENVHDGLYYLGGISVGYSFGGYIVFKGARYLFGNSLGGKEK